MVARLFEYRFGKREGLILQCGDGWGEIAPLPGFSRETLEEARAEILSLLPNLATAKPQCPSVQFGIASALRPLRSICVPLCALNTPKKDCSTLKLKLGHLSAEEAVSLVQPYIGHYRLRLDCNRKWSLSQALAFASHFSPADFEYLEEPVQSVAELWEFSRKTQFPIALDETFREMGLISLPTLKAVVVKPMLSSAIPKDVPSVFSSSYETSLGILHIALLATRRELNHRDTENSEIAQRKSLPFALPLPFPISPLGLDTFSDDLLSPSLRIEKGHLVWHSSPNPIRTDLLCQIAP